MGLIRTAQQWKIISYSSFSFTTHFSVCEDNSGFYDSSCCNFYYFYWYVQYTNVQLRVDKRASKREERLSKCLGCLIYSCTSWLESYIKIVWHTSVPHYCWTGRQHKLAASLYTLILGRMAVKEGAVSLLGIGVRRPKKTELSRTVSLCILNCLESAAPNAPKHCPSSFNWRGRIRSLTLDPPGKKLVV